MKAKILPFLIFLSGSISAQIPTQGLMAFFPFSSNARDSSNNKTHGTLHNVKLTTDRYGNPNCAYEFSGSSNSYIEFPATNVKVPTYTYSMWAKVNVKPMSGDIAFTLNIGSTGGDQSLDIANNYLGSYMGWLGGGYNTTSPNFGLQQNAPLSTTKWSHIVCVRDSNYAKLYVDKVLVDSMGVNNKILPYYGSGTVKAFIGIRNDFSGAFNGKIDDVMIYNRALTYQEVVQLNSDKSTSIDEIKISQIKFGVYPNPSHESFTIDLGNLNITTSALNVKVINNLGQEFEILSCEKYDQTIQVNHNLSPGIYYIQLTDVTGRVIGTEKLVVQ